MRAKGRHDGGTRSASVSVREKRSAPTHHCGAQSQEERKGRLAGDGGMSVTKLFSGQAASPPPTPCCLARKTFRCSVGERAGGQRASTMDSPEQRLAIEPPLVLTAAARRGLEADRHKLLRLLRGDGDEGEHVSVAKAQRDAEDAEDGPADDQHMLNVLERAWTDGHHTAQYVVCQRSEPMGLLLLLTRIPFFL